MSRDTLRQTIASQANQAVAPGLGDLLNHNISQEEAEAVIEVAEGENPQRDASRAVAEATAEVAAMLGNVDPIDVLQDAVSMLDEALDEGMPAGDTGPPNQQLRESIGAASLEQQARERLGVEDDARRPTWTNYEWMRDDTPEDGDGRPVEDLESEAEKWADEIGGE